MNWKRDRLAGTITDTVLVGTLIAVAFLLNDLRLRQAAQGFPVPLWLVVLVILFLVGVPVFLYTRAERTLYRIFMRILRSRLAELQGAADQLYRSAQGHLRLERLLDHLSIGLQDMEPALRIAFFVLDDAEQAMVLEAVYGFSPDELGAATLPRDDPLVRELSVTAGPLPLPIPMSLLPTTDPWLQALLGNDVHGSLMPLRVSGHLTGAALLSPAAGKSVDGSCRSVVTHLLDQAAVLIEDARLYSRAQRDSLEKDVLFQVGARISSALDRDTVLELILDGLKHVVGYDAAAIFVVNPETGTIGRHLVRGYDEESVDQLDLKVGRGLVGRAAETREPILVTDVRAHPHYVNAREETRTELNLPVAVEGEILAIISLASDRVSAYRERDLRLLQVFGSQAAIAIQNASLYEEARQKRDLEHELELAWDIQRALLPRSEPELPGIEVASFIQPSRSVGGDLYDLVALSENRLGVAIGDLSGKGTPAAILMASLYASFRSLTRSKLSLSEIMSRLNNLLGENVGLGRYATFFYGTVDTEKMEFRYSNAGHFPPLLLRAGETPRLLAEGGIVLGYIADSEYSEGIVELQSGDLLLLYTDGLLEAQNAQGEMFGEERVADIGSTLIGRSAEEVLAGLKEAVLAHCGGCAPEDDLTMVVVRVA